ncbi:hypothetical protein AAMO2058_001406900 [Amorphochlora amoebiformis]
MSDAKETGDTNAHQNPPKGSLRQRAKKFIASKAAATKLGKKIMNNFLGTNGEKIVVSLTKAASKIHGEKDAKTYQTDLYKIATKFKIMVDEKKLDFEGTKHAEEPLNTLGVQVLDALSSKKVGKTSIDRLHANIGRIRAIVLELMRAHLQVKNYKKLEGLFDVFGNHKFLVFVLNDADYKQEKGELFENLSIVLKDQMELLERQRAQSKPKICSSYLCGNARVEASGPFPGSRLCAMHHRKRYMGRLENPKIQLFVSEAASSPYFIQYLTSLPAEDLKLHSSILQGSKPTSLFNFLRAVRVYERIDRSLREQRAKVIMRKYMTKGSPSQACIEEKILAKVKSDLDRSGGKDRPKNFTRRQSIAYTAPPRELFQVVINQVSGRLRPIFKEFLKSDFYKNYAETIRLPPAEEKIADKQEKTREEKEAKEAKEAKDEKKA